MGPNVIRSTRIATDLHGTSPRLTATNKTDPTTLPDDATMDVWSINIGNKWCRVFTKAYFEPLIDIFINHTKPCQYGCRKPGGRNELIFGVKAMLDGTKGNMIE
eukprot:14295885-Ditylum_brightwellii.AAC.1